MRKKRHIWHHCLKNRAVSFCPMYLFAPVSPMITVIIIIALFLQCFHTLARSVYGWHAQRALLMIAEVSTKKNEPKRGKRDTALSILVQKSGPALAVLPDRRQRPCM